MSEPAIDDGHRELVAALSRAVLASKRIDNDAYNDHHKFPYTSADAVLEEARRALAEQGLVVVSDWAPGDQHSEDERTIHITRTLYHEGGGSVRTEQTWSVILQKGRPWDRALAGALTASLAYYLRDLLMLPRGASTDAPEARNDTDYRPPSERSVAPKRAAKYVDPDFDEEAVLQAFREVSDLATTEERAAIDACIYHGDTEKCRGWLRFLKSKRKAGPGAAPPAEAPPACAHATVSPEGHCEACGEVLEAPPAAEPPRKKATTDAEDGGKVYQLTSPPAADVSPGDIATAYKAAFEVSREAAVGVRDRLIGPNIGVARDITPEKRAEALRALIAIVEQTA